MKVRLAQNLGRCPHWWSEAAETGQDRRGCCGGETANVPANSSKEGTPCPKRGHLHTSFCTTTGLGGGGSDPSLVLSLISIVDIPPTWKIHPWWTVVRNDAEIFPQWFELQLHTMVNKSQEGFFFSLYGDTFTSPKLLGCRVYFVRGGPHSFEDTFKESPAPPFPP